MSAEPTERGVDIEQIADKIKALREAALRYARHEEPGAGLDLEAAAIDEARRSEERRRTYIAIVEAAERNRKSRGN